MYGTLPLKVTPTELEPMVRVPPAKLGVPWVADVQSVQNTGAAPAAEAEKRISVEMTILCTSALIFIVPPNLSFFVTIPYKVHLPRLPDCLHT